VSVYVVLCNLTKTPKRLAMHVVEGHACRGRSSPQAGHQSCLHGHRLGRLGQRRLPRKYTRLAVEIRDAKKLGEGLRYLLKFILLFFSKKEFEQSYRGVWCPAQDRASIPCAGIGSLVDCTYFRAMLSACKSLPAARLPSSTFSAGPGWLGTAVSLLMTVLVHD
jgi:hypothetical protein